MNIKCGCEKRALVRIYENAKNKNRLYYSYEDSVCGWLGWCTLSNVERNASVIEGLDRKIRIKDNAMDMSEMKENIQSLKEENKFLYEQMMQLDNVVSHMKIIAVIALIFIGLMLLFLFIVVDFKI